MILAIVFIACIYTYDARTLSLMFRIKTVHSTKLVGVYRVFAILNIISDTIHIQ